MLYNRQPRKLLVVTGPPYHKENDILLAQSINNYYGKKIVCGGTTAKIVSRELDRDVEMDLNNYKGGLPPRAIIKGIDLVTEGIITLAQVSKELDVHYEVVPLKKSVSEEIVAMMLESDEIEFISGTRINNAHQDPKLPEELEIRRNVVKRIADKLETKYLKKTSITYL